jgi:hypothetical protein
MGLSRPSAYDRRLAEAEAKEAARTAPAEMATRDAVVLDINRALGEQGAAIDGLRRGIAKLMVDERERSQTSEAKLAQRIVEIGASAATGATRYEARLAELEDGREREAKLE